MLRNRAVALILGIIASPLVIALGLGPLQSDSALNEPFSGRIDLLGATAEDFDALRIGLASLEQFDRAGIELNPLLPTTYINIADLYRMQGREAEGERMLRRAVEFYPDSGDIRHALGLSLIRRVYFTDPSGQEKGPVRPQTKPALRIDRAGCANC